MHSNKIPQLIQLANDKVYAKIGKPLSDVQQKILESILKGNKLKDTQISGYAESTIQRVLCPELWNVLSDTLGQRVRFNTVGLALENLLQLELDQSSKPSTPQASSTSRNTSSPDKLVSFATNPARPIPHNLPAPSCTTFIGRAPELDRLLHLLSAEHSAHLISVDGIGGVGKTTLVLEAAYRCLHASSGDSEGLSGIPSFDAIIFTSAKEFLLTPFGFLRSIAPRRTLKDIFRQIARVLEDLDITGASFDEQVELIRDALSCQRTLLIVDNLETIEDQQDVLGFLYELPLTVKAVITTREQIVFVPVRLTSMLEPEGLSLIKAEAAIKGVSLTEAESIELFQATGGIPIGITYAVGQLANGYSIQEVLHNISQATGDVARFCFETSVQPLRGEPAHHLLMALALFPHTAFQDTLAHIGVLESEPQLIQKELARLRSLSLVKQENNRYSMLPLTREYALAELNSDSELAQELRERWLEWYVRFTASFTLDETQGWQEQYFQELIQEWPNLQAVMEWCQLQDRYEPVKTLWENLRSFTLLVGRHVTRLGYWDDRLAWTAWLTQAAEHRADGPTAMQSRLDHAWTLIALGKPDQLAEAENILMRAWELRQSQDLLFQIDLARNLAQVKIEQSQFEAAESWLNQVMELSAQLQGDEQVQSQTLTQIYYCWGDFLFKTGQYEKSKENFQVALTHAQRINWTRAIYQIMNWLANIANQKGENDKAKKLLLESLREAEFNQDLVQIAYCQESLAHLHYTLGELESANDWVTKAIKVFEVLGVVVEVQEAQQLLGKILHLKTFSKKREPD